jgi:hypothetical protein
MLVQTLEERPSGVRVDLYLVGRGTRTKCAPASRMDTFMLGHPYVGAERNQIAVPNVLTNWI